jgi:hypothetical protein
MKQHNAASPALKTRSTPFILFLVGMVGCLFLFFSPAQKLLILPVIALFVGVIAYFVYLISSALRNAKTEKDIINKIPEGERSAYGSHPATHFMASAQRYTKVFNIIFIISTVLLLGIVIALPQMIESGATLLGLRVLLFFTTLLAWILSITAGLPLIRDQDIRFTEQYAIQSRTGAWQKIQHNRIITWSVWIIGAVAIPLLAISILVM